jgi:hypothetical protein
MRKGRRQKSHLGFFRSVSSAFAAPLRSPETMCARAASLSCRLSARRGSAGRFGSVPRLARTIFLAMMVGFTSAQTICTNTCSNYANQGTCDDGGPGAEFNGFCAYGTDCTDCGPRQETLTLCSSGTGCGASPCDSDYVTLSSDPDRYFYKTTWYNTCNACSGVARGGDMYIYQAYDVTGLIHYNVYLWFDCSNGRWTRSVVNAGADSETCPYKFACAGPYPAGTIIDPAWSSCPYDGAPICPAPGPSPPDSDELIGFLALIIIGVLLLVTFLCGGICVCLGVCVLPICCRPNPNPGPNSRAGLEMREVTVQGYDMGRVVVGSVHSDSRG